MKPQLSLDEYEKLKAMIGLNHTSLMEQIALQFDLPEEASRTQDAVENRIWSQPMLELKHWIEQYRPDPAPQRIREDSAEPPAFIQEAPPDQTLFDKVWTWRFNEKFDGVEWFVVSRAITRQLCVAQACMRASDAYAIGDFHAEQYAHILSVLTSDDSGMELTDGAVAYCL